MGQQIAEVIGDRLMLLILDNTERIANGQNLVGGLSWQYGDPERGKHYQREAIETAGQHGDDLGWAMSTSQLADQLIDVGKFDEAEPLLRAATPIIERERQNALLLTQSSIAYLSSRSQLSSEDFLQQWSIGNELTIPQSISMAILIAQMRSPGMTDPSPAESDSGLTPRERGVLTLLVAGKSNTTIADELFIRQRTVTTHLTRLYAKLGVATRTEAISAAMRLSIVETS